MRLFHDHQHPDHWIAYHPREGYVAFPARSGGWAERHPARGLDPMKVREVSVRMAEGTGMPGEPGVIREEAAMRARRKTAA